jgi:predicted NAD/FAD-binding protein
MKNGFHEDGLASAVDVVEALGRERASEVAAE